MKEPKTVTIDASVFVSSLLKESNSEDAIKLLDNQNLQIICPCIVLTEIISAVFRVTKDKDLKEIALKFILELSNSDNFKMVDIDEDCINESIGILKNNPLKGMDSLYVAVASIYDTELVTLDKDQLKVNAVKTHTVKSFLRNSNIQIIQHKPQS